MSRPVTVNIPHSLGTAEAHRRIEKGFAAIGQQMAGGLLGLASFQSRWEGDCLRFDGGALGQTITGQLNVLPDSVQIQVDLPELLAAIADRIKAGLTKETQKLLEKK